MITVKRKVQIVRRAYGRKAVEEACAARPVGPHVPRISRLMALAIYFDRLVRQGQVEDISQLARLCHVSQPRMTQIMNLNHLAPDIQEQLLFLPAVEQGREQVHEKMLRPLAAEIEWDAQRPRRGRLIDRLPAASRLW